jgi:hypothetical protein
MAKPNAFHIEHLAIGQLQPYGRNARKHGPKQIAQIAASIREFGFVNPVLIDRQGGIIAGHGRVEAAKLLGLESVPCVRLNHLTGAQKRAYILADNRLAELAGWDQEVLAIELQFLVDDEVEFEPSITGFEIGEIDLLLTSGKGEAAEPDSVEEIPSLPTNPVVTRPGDVWRIGRHKLICGDALDPEVYDLLLGSELAQMVFTDPPYNVPIQGHVSGLGRVRHREFAMASGEMSKADFTWRSISRSSPLCRLKPTMPPLSRSWHAMRGLLTMATAEQIAALYRLRFSAFLRFAFGELYPGRPFVDAPHVDLLADSLAKATRGEITRLVINMPPRTLKSFAASVALPAWLLGNNPTRQVITVAGTREVAAGFEKITQELLAKPRLLALFPHLGGVKVERLVRLPHGGRRMSAVVGGSLVGLGDADLIVVDAPNVPAQVNDASRRKAVKNWFDMEVLQRLEGNSTCSVIVLMHRLHVDDLSAHLLNNKSTWTHINLPAIAMQEERWTLSNGRALSRRKGDPLAPALESREALFERMVDIGAYSFGAQYQQNPFKQLADDERRGGFFVISEEWGFQQACLCRVCEKAIMAYEVFGLGDRNPALRPRKVTNEEFERYARWVIDYQRRLQTNPNARFGPPEAEAHLWKN